ncbi:unnamed protein product [Schistocephalus solidus]|uniref:BTB domain-containing protein n=1 Tax=Schistocephalus solidus TaxID=70667 RepID=A0A183SC81_SCHSO|nr:unnamed protein product [Schistocephalus solidus]
MNGRSITVVAAQRLNPQMPYNPVFAVESWKTIFYLRLVPQENQTYTFLNALSPTHLDKVLDSWFDTDAPLDELCDLQSSVFSDSQSYGEALAALHVRLLSPPIMPQQFVDELMRQTHLAYPYLSAKDKDNVVLHHFIKGHPKGDLSRSF